MLFDPTRHSVLNAPPWDDATARSVIAEIVADACGHFDPEKFWPAHPADDFVRDGSTQLYFGAAGNVWALDSLARDGAADVPVNFATPLSDLLMRNRAEMAMIVQAARFDADQASFLMGDVPILILQMKMTPATQLAEELHARVSANLSLPVLELMWGVPGTMLACTFAHRITGEDRWRTLFQEQAQELLSDIAETEQGPLWSQQLYGQTSHYLGLVHGFAGHMAALIRGWDWLGEAERKRVHDLVTRTLVLNAQRADGFANWTAKANEPAGPLLVQICHGAPGMVVAFCDSRIATPELIVLLKQAGGLVWKAGPLAKGSGLCHGTAGNGYAFLKLHALTGEDIWLERARAFAMHAIGQWREAFGQYGRGRYSLWTGDTGVALYLWNCIRATAQFPTLDDF